LTLKVVTHVDRSVSIGQLPSARWRWRRKASPWVVTGQAPNPEEIKHMVTNAVSGMASRNPPLAGTKPSSLRNTG